MAAADDWRQMIYIAAAGKCRDQARGRSAVLPGAISAYIYIWTARGICDHAGGCTIGRSEPRRNREGVCLDDSSTIARGVRESGEVGGLDEQPIERYKRLWERQLERRVTVY